MAIAQLRISLQLGGINKNTIYDRINQQSKRTLAPPLYTSLLKDKDYEFTIIL